MKYEHQFIIILRKRVVGQHLPTLLDITCWVRLHTLLHILGCRESSCGKFETDPTFSYMQWTQQLPRILGVVNLSDIWWSTFKSVRHRFAPLQLVCEQKLYPTIVNWVEWLWNPSDSFVICFCGPESAQRSKEFLSFWLYWPIKTLH